MISIKVMSDLNKMVAILDKGLREHAVQQTGFHGFDDPIAFAAIQENEIIGGVLLQLFRGALHLKDIWVRSDCRGKGVGSQLMETATSCAIKERCPFIFLETFSFQALEFYRQHGFRVVFSRSGFSENETFYYLQKDLD